MLQVVLLYVLGEIVHLKTNKQTKKNYRHAINVDILREKSNSIFSTVISHLYRAGHCAEGKHSGTVLYGGLAVKCSLSVDEEHSNLLGTDENTMKNTKYILIMCDI